MIADFFILLAKKAHKSKTIIFGILVAMLGAAQTYLPELQGIVGPEVYGKLTFGIGVIVAALRVATTTDLRDK
jgi:hypothetical protein